MEYILLSNNVKKIFKFFLTKREEALKSRGLDYKFLEIPAKGKRLKTTCQKPIGHQLVFLDDDGNECGNTKHAIREYQLPENFFEDAIDIFPIETENNYRYSIIINNDASAVEFELTIYRLGFIEMLQINQTTGSHILGTCKFNFDKHVKKEDLT